MPRLVLVPTPIGNLEDLTFRALRTLREADLIAAEDTRLTARLLQHYGVETPRVALHQHNEHTRLPSLLDRVRAENLVLAVVTDAGTPAISDPGFLAVREALRREIEVETLPGPVAFIPALVNSGLPCERFVFEGFLPHKKGRRTRLEQLRTEARTMVFYESPYRIQTALAQMADLFGGDRPAAVSRELTKIYEETIRGTLSELHQHFEHVAPKGEFVLVVAGSA